MDGQTIATIRKFHDLHQSELAAMLDVTQSYIARIENGRRSVTKSFIVKITAALDLTLEKIQAIIVIERNRIKGSYLYLYR